MATISSHVLDSVAGDHARNIRVECIQLGPQRTPLFDVRTDADGRIRQDLNIDRRTEVELVFHSAEYFGDEAQPAAADQIMNTVIARILLPGPQARVHLPVVLSPHSYTIWWSGAQR